MPPGATLQGLGQAPLGVVTGQPPAVEARARTVQVPVLHLSGARLGALVGTRAFRQTVAVGMVVGGSLGYLAAVGVRSWAEGGAETV
jgi:hypothetical protein